MNPSHNYQGSVLIYILSTGKTLGRSKNGFTLVPMPEDAIPRITFMAKESPTGLVFQDRLENPYDEEEPNGLITICFTDTPLPAPDDPDTHITDTEKGFEPHCYPGDSLNNTCSIDPDSDHITIHITGVNDPVPNNSTIDEDPEEESDN